MNVLICCGARGNITSDFEDAEDLGYQLAQRGYGVVYGGGYGVMEAMAAGHVKAGGEPIGITLMSIADKKAPPSNRLVYERLTLPERKGVMLGMCSAAIVLPGGLGTLDELFELCCAKKLGHWSGPIVLLNLRGYWDHMLAQLRQCVADGYWNGDNSILTVVDTVVAAVTAVGASGTQHAAADRAE